jgi:hypothetical protein
MGARTGPTSGGDAAAGDAAGGDAAAAAASVTRGGDASDEEVAAIVAAIEVTRPRPAPPGPDTAPPRWRFSGRWWTKPVPLDRGRPW